ncbi:MAG: magnesium-dependent phosphatase-1 [Planctomycetota bacterium]|jgi:magnesium-dependent phosphatase 1|nr:magnesium-dependent phosphatase-1 [Planctomycetota bacterium]
MARLLVFDLDFTLWDCGGTWCDCTRPPYRGHGDAVYDADGRSISLYPDVLAILDACDERGIAMALASRTEAPPWARELLTRLGIEQRFGQQEIYPGEKTRHFARIQADSGIAYRDMAFFDDEQRNIRAVSALGVQAIHVPTGLRWAELSQVAGWD